MSIFWCEFHHRNEDGDDVGCVLGGDGHLRCDEGAWVPDEDLIREAMLIDGEESRLRTTERRYEEGYHNG